MKQSFVIFLCFLFVPLSVFANKQYSFLQVSNSDGLVNNQITCIHKDKRGFVWIGTVAGLSRYDGYNFVNNKHNSNDPSTLIDNYIVNIQEDIKGNLWIKTRWNYVVYDIDKEAFNEDLTGYLGSNNVTNIDKIYIDNNYLWIKPYGNKYFSRFDPKTQTLTNVFKQSSNESHSAVDFLCANGSYYYLLSDGTIECYDVESYKLKYKDDYLVGKLGVDSLNTHIFVDTDDDIWFFGNNNGLYHYQLNKQQWHHYSMNCRGLSLTSDLIKDVVQDNKGQIWVATDHGGIDIINKYSKQVTTLRHQTDNEKSVAQNSITDLYIDDKNIIWVGTFKNGVSYYHESIHKFLHYRHLLSDPSSLPFNDVNCFVEDRSGNLWIGMNGGGLVYYNRKTNSYKTYQYDKNNPNSISCDVVVGLYIDSRGALWVGTFTGGLNRFDGKKFIRYQYNEKENNGLTSNNIWSINEDSEGNIWIGTLGGGIVLYNYDIGGFTSVLNNGSIVLPTDFIGKITRLSNGDMFIGTAEGIVFYDTKEKRYKYHPNDNRSEPLPISSKNINDVFEDSRGLLWVATREGLVVFDPHSDYIKHFTDDDGLPEDVVNCIEEDEFHSIWISKSTGLSQIVVTKLMTEEVYLFQILDFTEEDGLQAKEFNPNASYKTSRGELIFGGPNGFNMFKSKDIIYSKVLPRVVFTGFRVYNQDLSPNSKVNNVKLLEKSVVLTNSIELKHEMNVFSINFSALDFYIPNKIKYKYMLEGFNDQWILFEETKPTVTYTNLNPGDYYFRVKASNSDGLWNDDYSELHIRVMPPWYFTTWAYIVYIIIIILLFVYIRFSMLQKERIRFSNEQERLQTKRNHEMDEMKLRFLTNVSHEFRTPLTLILPPLDRLLKQSQSDSDKRLLEIINRNAKHLLNLVNQLLDLRKLELHGLRYHPSLGDIVSFLEDVCEDFNDAFQKKSITFVFNHSTDYFSFNFDKEKLEKVVMNLLSNALKFTPEGGDVAVDLEVNELIGFVNITVQDNGVGIAEEDLDKIFVRFYQSEENRKMGISGSGIGLNLVREMVQLHNGEIKVKSKRGKGSKFIVVLPVDKSDDESIKPNTIEKVVSNVGGKTTLTGKRRRRATILLVEDNLDFRTFMKETLQEFFEVSEAPDGQKGYDKAIKLLPDLIISDVMMPNLDGLEMSKRLKNDIRTSHIPIVLLTARTADEDKIKGLKIGADDYITKPFNMDFLLLKVNKLIEKRGKMQKQFQKTVEINPSEVQITSMDEKLIKKAIVIVEKNIAESKFSVEDLSRELGMSRVYLYKKLMSITGKSPIEFIRIIRLKRGARLLEKSQMNIAEVAYEVGFNSPRYFSKYFKEEYGMLPTAYLKKIKTNKPPQMDGFIPD